MVQRQKLANILYKSNVETRRHRGSISDRFWDHFDVILGKTSEDISAGKGSVQTNLFCMDGRMDGWMVSIWKGKWIGT